MFRCGPLAAKALFLDLGGLPSDAGDAGPLAPRDQGCHKRRALNNGDLAGARVRPCDADTAGHALGYDTSPPVSRSALMPRAGRVQSPTPLPNANQAPKRARCGFLIFSC